jgi:hypothetical protein
VIGQINVILGQDMPIVLLGQAYSPLQMQKGVAEYVFEDVDVIDDRYRRYQIYRNYSIVRNVRIDAENALKRENFMNFVMSNISRDKKVRENADTPPPRDNPFEDLVTFVD